MENNQIVTNEVEEKTQNKTALKKIAMFVGVVAFAGIVYGAYWGLYASHFQETENAYVSAIQNAITSQVGGNCVEVGIQDGQIVKTGQSAVVLDDTDYKLALDKAGSDLASAVRNYVGLQYTSNQNKDSLNSKINDLSHAQLDFQRDEASFKAGVITKQQFDDTAYRLKQAQIAVSGANTSYANAKVQALAKNAYEHPDVARAINAYKQAYINLQRTHINIPVDGTIAKKSVYVGQNIAPNQVLFTVINTQDEWIDANLKEPQLKNVKPGQPVEITSDVNDKKYKGYVSSIQAGSGSALSLLPAQNATGNWIKIVQRVPVRIDFDPESLKQQGPVPIGTSMNVTIDTTQKGKIIEPKTDKTEVYNIDEKLLDEQVKTIVMANLK